jgi:cell division protein FtsQ
MASNSNRRYGSSGRSGPRKRVVIGADETVRVRYHQDRPQVEAERRSTTRQDAKVATKRAGVERPASRHGKRISAAKREERERRRRMLKVRRWTLLVMAAATVVACVWVAVALYRAPVFPVKAIRVTGARHLSRADVLDQAEVPAGATLLRLPAAAIERRLEANAWVQRARVSRDFPSTIVVQITERRPVAVVDAGGTDLWMIAADGFWLGRRSAEDSNTMIIRDLEDVAPVAGKKTTSKELLNAVRIATGLSPELSSVTRAISAPTIEKTALITDDDVEIYVGDATQLAAKDRVAREILRRQKGKVVYINVRVVDRPTWRGLDEAK